LSVNEGSPIPKLHREAPAGAGSGFLLHLHFKGCMVHKQNGQSFKKLMHAVGPPLAVCLL